MMRWIETLRRLGRWCIAGSLAMGFAVVTATAEELRLNEIQVIGTHNSYHLAPCAGDPGYRRFRGQVPGRRARLLPLHAP